MNNKVVLMFVAVVLASLLVSGCGKDPIEARDNYLASAQEYLDEQRYEEAVIEFRNAIREDPGHIPSYLGIAGAFQKMGDHESAIRQGFNQVIRLDGSNIEAMLGIGEYMIAAGRNNPDAFRQAQEKAEAVLAIDPLNVKGLILLGNAYAGQNEVEKSIAEYEKALAQDPANLQASLNLAAARFRNREVEKAETTFRKVLQDHPEEIPAFIATAAFYASIQKPQESESYLKRAFDLNPADGRILYTLASFYLSGKDPLKAEEIFKEAITRKPGEREPLWGLASFYLQQGRIDAGVEALSDLLKLWPDDAAARLRLAEILLNRNEDDTAEENIRSVLKRNDQNAQAHYLLGKIMRRQKEFEQAMTEFDSAIKFNGSLAPAYLEKANLQLMQGDLDGCETTLQTILKQMNYLPARGALAKLQALRQRPEEALNLAGEVLAGMPDNTDALLARAEAYRLLGKFEESRTDWLKLCEMQPENADYRHRLGTVEAMRSDNAAALAHFRKAVDLNPSMVAAINDIIYLHLKAKQYDAAIAELDRLSEGESPKDEIHRFRGQVYMSQGDYPAAESEWRKTIELNPENYRTYLLLGQLNMQQNRIPEAIREVDELLERRGDFAAGYLLKAYYLQVDNKTEDAIKGYRKALELDSENFIAANNLAWLLCENNRNLEEALSLAKAASKEARKMGPDNPEIAETLGWIYYKMGSYTLAADQLLASVNNRNQPSAEHYYRLGMALYKKGDITGAKQTLKKALDLDAGFDGADEAREILSAV